MKCELSKWVVSQLGVQSWYDMVQSENRTGVGTGGVCVETESCGRYRGSWS
jgi:hypothetical protein